MGVVSELKDYYTNPANENKRKYIKGLNPNTNNIILENEAGIKKEVSMEDLNNGLFNFEKFELEEKDEILEENDFEMIEELDESKDESIEMVEETNNVYTMQELKNAVELKDITTVDKILSEFAINPNTGLVDIDVAIGAVTKNTIDLTIKNINENKKFETDLSRYSVDGKLMEDTVQNTVNNVDPTETLEAGFNNILLLVEVAKQKGVIYSEENIERAKKIFVTQVKDRLNIKELEKKDNIEASTPSGENIENEEPKNEIVERKSYIPTLKPDNNMKKAGFADIFILTIIVLVYAAIIVNLVMKLK